MAASQLCYVWGKVRDQSALILLDPGSTHNFISVDLAQCLGISTDEVGPALDARGAFKGQEVLVTPLIGKLCIHMQAYMDSEEFYVSPLLHQDVILGAPWFHCMYAHLRFLDRVVKFTHLGKEFKIQARSSGNSIPLVSNDSVSKVMKRSLFAYMIYVKDSPSQNVLNVANDVKDGNNDMETKDNE